MLSLSFVTDVIAMAVSFALAVLIGHFAIPVLQRLKASQTERNIMESHVKKNGTPTMGGVIFLGAMLLTCLACVHIQPQIIPEFRIHPDVIIVERLCNRGNRLVRTAADGFGLGGRVNEHFNPRPRIGGDFASMCAAAGMHPISIHAPA